MQSTARLDLNLSGEDASARFEAVLVVAAGLPIVMPATTGVEGGFSLIHYRRNEYSSVLPDFALEGRMHA